MVRQVLVSIIWVDKCVNIYTIGRPSVSIYNMDRQVWVDNKWMGTQAGLHKIFFVWYPKFLSNSTPTCKPNSTSVVLSRSWLCFPTEEGRRKKEEGSNPHLAFSRGNDSTCLIFGECLVGVWRVYGNCLESIWWVSGGCLAGVLWLSGGCLKGFWKVP